MGIYSTNIIDSKGNGGMTLLSSHKDDNTVKFSDIGFDFFYNGVNCRTSINISPKVIQTFKPKPVILTMKDDISFSEAYIKDIINTVVTLDNTGSGIINFIVSVDSGVSWKAWNSSLWD